jgi:protoporphyrinogen/coproporphyrinogen III oxidase
VPPQAPPSRELLHERDETLLALARAELARTLATSAEPLFHRVTRWPRSMPQYTLGHPARLAMIEQRLAALPGLYLAGAAYRGVGIPDCIHSGESAARTALHHCAAVHLS